jgi:hypothetical protein
MPFEFLSGKKELNLPAGRQARSSTKDYTKDHEVQELATLKNIP